MNVLSRGILYQGFVVLFIMDILQDNIRKIFFYGSRHQTLYLVFLSELISFLDYEVELFIRKTRGTS